MTWIRPGPTSRQIGKILRRSRNGNASELTVPGASTLIEHVDSYQSLKEEEECRNYKDLVRYIEGTIARFDAITVNGQSDAHHIDSLRHKCL